MTSLAPVASPGHAAGSVRRRARPAARLRIPSLVLLVYALALGGGLGVGSAVGILGADYPFGRVRVGPWTAWPQSGSREADPYMRAIIARRGDLPLGLGEGLALTRDGGQRRPAPGGALPLPPRRRDAARACLDARPLRRGRPPVTLLWGRAA